MSNMSGSPNKPDFEELYDSLYDKIYRYTYTILLNREDAEDIVAETFLSAYRSYDRFDSEKATPQAWLVAIAHNYAVNLVRSAAYRRRAAPETVPEEADPSHDFVGKIETEDLVSRLYARLTEEEREFLNLRYVMEFRDAEVGELLGLSPKTVNKRYQRLLEKCRRLLSQSETQDKFSG